LYVEHADSNAVKHVRKGLEKAFPGFSCEISQETLPVPKDAYDPARNQYNSSIILSSILEYPKKHKADRVLGITDLDLYIPHLNFVFGEAQYLGKAAIISLHRVKPEFYGQQPNYRLFCERAVKEAIHEIGHTMGLSHCNNINCVMFFSLHIGMTDRKDPSFCEICHNRLASRS